MKASWRIVSTLQFDDINRSLLHLSSAVAHPLIIHLFAKFWEGLSSATRLK